jgi:microcystin-dependent protein
MPSHSHTLKDFRILTDQNSGMGYDGCINSNTSSAGRKWKQFAPNGTKTDCVNTNFNSQTKFELNTAGSSGKHNNVPPYTCVNFIIKHS